MLESLVAARPLCHEAFGLLGVLAAAGGDDEEAERRFARALAIDPLADYARARGRALDRLGRSNEAMTMFVEARRLLPAVSESADRFAEEIRQFIEASRRDLTAWTLASWRAAPAYQVIAKPPAFIVGFPHSGASLVRRLIDPGGRLAFVAEAPALAALREHLQRHGEGIANVPRYLGQIPDEVILMLRVLYYAELSKRLPRPARESKRIVDQNPMNLIHLAIIRRVFPDAPVIVCVRDPRDAVLSAFMGAPPNAALASVFRSVECAAEFCFAAMGAWMEQREILGLRCLEVRFEEMVSAPGEMRRRIAAFLGEPEPEEPALEPGWIPRGSVGRWTRYRDEVAPMLDTLRPLVERLGYDAPGRG